MNIFNIYTFIYILLSVCKFTLMFSGLTIWVLDNQLVSFSLEKIISSL